MVGLPQLVIGLFTTQIYFSLLLQSFWSSIWINLRINNSPAQVTMLHAGIFLEMRESDCFLPLSRLPTATAVWFRCGVHFTSALPVDRHVLKLDVCLRSLIACGSTETKHMFLWHRWHPKQSEHWQSRIAWCSEASGGAILMIKQDPKRAVASSLLPPQLVSRVTTANPIFL